MFARALPFLLVGPTLSLADTPLPADPHPGLHVAEVSWGDTRWRVATVDLEELRVGLVGQAPGDPHRFQDLPSGVLLAMNAGIYETLSEPTGWFVEGGTERHPLNVARGHGNFFLQPNGAFWIDEAGPAIAPSRGVAPIGAVVAATQSGPLLRWRGEDQPGVDPTWQGRTSRNAVGVLDPTHVVFVYTDGQVTLRALQAFMGQLGVDDALYLDGTVSDLCVGHTCDRPSRSWAGILVVTE